VQTTRIATQPFEQFLAGPSSSSSSSSSRGSPGDAEADALCANALWLESLAARHGISLVAVGSSSQPRHLRAIPRLIAKTQATSCTFHLPPGADWGLCSQVAVAVLQVAGLTGE
jgi:hypothetical protein